MKKVVSKLNELFDPWTWDITIKNNEDQIPIFYLEVEGEEICRGTKKELLKKLNDEKTLFGFS